MDPLNKALSLLEQGDNDQAFKILNSYIKTANDDEKYQIAQLYLEFGFIQNAQEIIQTLLEEDPHNSEYKLTLAHIYIETENDDQAFHLLYTIDTDDPAYLPSLIQLADLYEAQGLYEVAEQKLYEAKRHDPDEKIIDFALAELLFSVGKYDQCINFYERVLTETEELGHVSIINRLAEAYASIGKYEKAFDFYQQDTSEDPDTLFKYGLTAFHSNRIDIAISVWEQVVETDPHYYTVYYHLGTAYQENELYVDAYKTAQEGLQFDEHNDDLYYLAATLAYQNGELQKSKKYIQKAVELNPENSDVVLFFVKLLTESEQYEEIVDFINDLRKHHIYDPLYEWKLAQAYNELDEVNQALPHYKEAYKSFQQDVEFLHQYGLFLAEIGLQKEAIDVLTKYLQIEPMDTNIADYVDRLNESFDEY